jgi:hypothetical protein
MTERPSALSFLDALFGYNRPGTIGFGSQRYQFRPYPRMTELQARDAGLTEPVPTLKWPGGTFTAPSETPPLDLIMPEGPPELTTRDVPLPGIVGRRLDPKFMDLLLQARLKENFERFKLQEQHRLWDRFGTDASPTDIGGATFDLPGALAPTPAPTGTSTPTVSTLPAPAGALPLTADLSPQFLAGVRALEQKHGIAEGDLLRVMAFETSGTFSPSIPNAAGSSGRGLIQLTNRGAAGLGISPTQFAKLSREDQLPWIDKYLARYSAGGRLGTLKDLYLALFKPAAIGAGEGEVLYRQGVDGLNYSQNAKLDRGNKGYITTGDALTAVQNYPRVTAQPTQEQAPALANQLPSGSVQVAGPGAPATVTPTGPPVDVAQPPPFRMTPEAQQRIDSNNRRTLANNRRLEALDLERRRAQLGVRTGLPGMTDRLRSIEESIRAVRQENTGFYNDSEKILADEQKEWRTRFDRLQQEDRAAQRAREAKGEERIGPEAGRKLNLPATTKWKDVPENARILDDPGPSERKVFADLKGAYDGVNALLPQLDKQEVREVIGTWFSHPENTFWREVGRYLDRLTPAQRKFMATVAREVSTIRHQLAGATQTVTELENLRPFLPDPGDVDARVVRAKLEVLRDGLVQSHEAYRDQLDKLGIRTPPPLAPRPSQTPAGSTGTGSNAPQSIQDRLLQKYMR